MNLFLELGNRYAKKSTWVDFALVKFCMSTIGLFVGMHVKEKDKKRVSMFAAFVFLATYIPLMAKIFGIMEEMSNE